MIKNIIIVGGGATGWMAAAYLNRFHPDIEITLIESPIDPTLGVGESLNNISKRFNNALGIDERDFLRSTNGTFKIGIQFNHFNNIGSTFYHPFGQADKTIEKFSPNADQAFLSEKDY